MAKHTDVMHMRHAMTNLVNCKDYLHCLNFIQLKKNFNFRLISGVQHLEKNISGFRFYHQKMRNKISGGLLGGIFEIQGCLMPEKSILELFFNLQINSPCDGTTCPGRVILGRPLTRFLV